MIPLSLLKKRKGSGSSIIFSSLSTLSTLGSRPNNLAGRASFALLSLFIIFAAISLARPQKKNSYEERKASGIDIIIAMDISYSMEIADFNLDGRRVQRDLMAREVVKEFIKHRPNDRIGLIPFAGQPYQESPITLEHQWLLEKIDDVRPNDELTQGTAIGSAVSASAIRLDKRKDTKSRIIVLITDGSNNSGNISPLQAAEAANQLGIKVYTVAIGTTGGRLHRQAAPAQEFDTETLEKIAKITNAQYFRAKTTEQLVEAFTVIDELEKTERTKQVITTYADYHHYFTFAAALSLLSSLLVLTLYQPPAPE
ncbi:VWA domain-containing protein [Rubritalea spongiae]|uniref:VWA domain-containing protein n=1 Tax=Rubritalea spongiae TaxID=430797 RepID=A0ABW5E5V6_9BACT